MSEEKRVKKSKRFKKKRRANRIYIGIVLCILLIIASIAILLMPNDFKFSNIQFPKFELPKFVFLKEVDPNEVSDENNSNKGSSNSANSKKEASEDRAREIAVAEFEKLGEKVSKDSLTVLNLERKDGLMYYYIKSEKNTCEVRKKDGVLTRLNANPVNQ